MSSIDETVQDILALALELQDAWHAEDNAGAWTGTGESPYVSGGGRSDPTGTQAGRERKWADRDRIGSCLRRTVEALEREAQRHRSRHVTSGCCTPGCEGRATHDGRCWRCFQWIRSNRHANMTPDQVPGLVDDWNGRRQRDCACSTDCCPDGCWDDASPPRRVSERCKKRMDRMRAAEREAS